MLTLTIKKKWFDMIKCGFKKEEYREIKPYYDRLFREYISHLHIITPIGAYQHYDPFYVIFRNGYKKNSPKIECKCVLSKGTGVPEWGAEPNKEYYILKILGVWEV